MNGIASVSEERPVAGTPSGTGTADVSASRDDRPRGRVGRRSTGVVRRGRGRRVLARLVIALSVFLPIGVATASPASAQSWDYYSSVAWYDYYGNYWYVDIYSSPYITGWSLYCTWVNGAFVVCNENY